MARRITIILMGLLLVLTPTRSAQIATESDESIEVVKVIAEEDVPLTEDVRALSEDDREMLARLVYHEARGESFEGQVAVVEVVLNRVASDSFPGTIAEVIMQPGQFSPAKILHKAKPSEVQYSAVDTAWSGVAPVLSKTTVYFSTRPQNSRISAVIGSHYFCEE